MEKLTDDLFDHKILVDPTSRMTRQERRSAQDPIRGYSGPILDKSCNKVCSPCLRDLRKDKVPKFALVNGNWLGDVPKELQGLTMFEQMLISRLRHNACVLKVHVSEQYKMEANTVMFSVQCQKFTRGSHFHERKWKRLPLSYPLAPLAQQMKCIRDCLHL